MWCSASPTVNRIAPSSSCTTTARGEECSVSSSPSSNAKTTTRRAELFTTTRDVVDDGVTGMLPSRSL